MAFITAEIKIPETGNAVTTHLYFPTDLPDAVGNTVKGVITLLHGMGNSGADWMQMSAAARYAADNGYILVAPSAQNSFYTNMAYGPPWYIIITQLLPAQLQRIFNIPTAREQNYIAGLSMGGYGAMRIGLSQPQRYAAVGSFSGALDMGAMLAVAAQAPVYRPFMTPLFGEDLTLPEEADLFYLARQVAALPKTQQPRLYCSWGAQDEDDTHIRTQNLNFVEATKDLGLSLTCAEWEGVHEWNFWDRSLAEFIGFIQGSDYGERKRGDWTSEKTYLAGP